MKRLTLLCAVAFILMYGCKGHIQQDDYHSPRLPQDDEKIDMRVIKPSDSTKLRQEQEDSNGRIYK